MKSHYKKIIDLSQFVDWFIPLYAMDTNEQIANSMVNGNVRIYLRINIPSSIIKLYNIQKYKSSRRRVCIPSIVTDKLIDYWYQCGWLLSIADNVPYIKHSRLKLHNITKKKHLLSKHYTIIRTTIIGKVIA